MPVISVDDPTSGIDTRPPGCSLQNIDVGADRQIENQESSSRSTVLTTLHRDAMSPSFASGVLRADCKSCIAAVALARPVPSPVRHVGRLACLARAAQVTAQS